MLDGSRQQRQDCEVGDAEYVARFSREKYKSFDW